MLVLAPQKRQEPTVLAFADAHVLENLEGVLQFGEFLPRDPAAVEPHTDFVNVRPGKSLGQIDEQLYFPRRELQLSTELHPHLPTQIRRRKIQRQTVAESPPYCRVEQFMVVRRGDDDGLIAKRIQVLDEAVHNPLQLSKLLAVAAQLRDRIELIEKQDTRSLSSKIEKSANVFRRAPEERRNQAIEARDVQVKAQLLGDVPREAALPRPRRAVHQKTQRRREAMNIGLCVALRDAQKFVDGIPLVLPEHNRRLGKCFEIHPFYQREPAIGID